MSTQNVQSGNADFLCIFVCSGNGAQVAHLLGMGSERANSRDSWESELRRRRFWACYLMQCHAVESLFVSQIAETTVQLTLPWREDDFERGTPTAPRTCLESGESNGGIFSELIKALTFW